MPALLVIAVEAAACDRRVGPQERGIAAERNPAAKLSISRRVVRRSDTPTDDEASATRFMMLGKATKASEAGQLPTHDELVAMDKYIEELQKAGILLELVGLAPSSKGARIRTKASGAP